MNAPLHGLSLIAGTPALATGKTFFAVSPLDRTALAPDFYEASAAEVDEALVAADSAFDQWRTQPASTRADLLDAIAAQLMALGDTLVERMHLESGLPKCRILFERARTCMQLQTFAAVAREGSWVDARLDKALPDRQPFPRPDLRRMLVPLGPVVVLGASNFPLAFSTPGNDTASALAAGCPVIVKAHPAHPGTSELVARAIYAALEECGLPAGIFSLLHGTGADVAIELVKHPLTRALGFTGSERAGRALFDAAAARPEPIPVFAEMGSLNPVFLLPGALKEHSEKIAAGLNAAFTAGVGQYCTKPGLVFALGGPDFDQFAQQFRAQVATVAPATMLHPGICDAYDAGVQRVQQVPGVTVLGESDADADAAKTESEPVAFTTDAETFLLQPELHKEVFGPYTLLISARNPAELEAAARSLQGQLSATFFADEHDFATYGPLLRILERKTGRLVLNGFPNSVEVCPAVQHGGPYPATTDSRFTSVGTAAIQRWARPLCWQNSPHDLLPAELRDENPGGLWRLVDGELRK